MRDRHATIDDSHKTPVLPASELQYNLIRARRRRRVRSHLDAVSLPGLPPEAEDGDAGDEAGDEAAEEAALAEVVGALVLLARKAEGAAAAWIRRGKIAVGFNPARHNAA